MTFAETQVDDFWGDTGTVGVETARNTLTEKSSPVVTVHAYDNPHDIEPLHFTPEQARTFAAAIIAAADHLDPKGARPLAVRDKDGDVWTRISPDEYHFDGMRSTLAGLTTDYGPLTEMTS